MLERPPHLTRENASRFRDRSVVANYPLRLPYPAAIFDTLVALIRDTPRTVLDAGTGTGELARPLAARVERVDALDPSPAMIAAGQRAPGGDRPNLRWIEGYAEDATVFPHYALITTGDSLHWMDWEVVLPRFHDLLTPRGRLAIVHRSEAPPPWQEGLDELIETYSTTKNFLKGFDLIATLESWRLFTKEDTLETAPVTYEQTVEEYIQTFHSRSSFSPEKMPPGDLAAFDDALRNLVLPFSERSFLTLQTVGGIVWGRPGVSGQGN